MRPFRLGLCAAVAVPLFTSVLAGAPSDAAGQRRVVLAEDPAQLLKLLPPAPPGWDVTTSQGTGQVSECPALRTSAIREYRFAPPPLPSGQAAPPQVTRITLTDTAYDPDALFQFDHFVPKPRAEPAVGGAPAFYLLEDCPAIEMLAGPKRLLLVSVSRRFSLVMEFTNQDGTGRDSWMRQLDLPRLKEAAANAPAEPLPPHKLKVDFVDELNPANNQESYIPYLTPEEQAAQKKAMSPAGR